MNDTDLDKLYNSKGRQSEDLARIKKLVAISHLKRVQPKDSLFSGKLCPLCGSKLDKKTVNLSKDESAYYYCCSNLDCNYEYAKKIENQKWGFRL